MSTKTTFKRVALVTVAAMGFGLLSVAPSTATSQTDTLAVSSATSTCLIAATTCSITLTQTMLTVSGDTMSVTASLSSNGNVASVAMPVMTDLIGLRTGDAAADGGNTGYPYVSADGLTGLNYDTVSSSNTTYRSVTAKYKVAFTPTHAGTFVVSFAAYNMLTGTTRSTVAAVAPAVTWTITVAALAESAAADASSTSITNSYGVATGSADKTIRIAAGSSLAGAATIVVISKVDDVVATGSSVVSASVSGPGTLLVDQTSTGGTSTGFKVASFKASSGTVYVHLFADGTTGTSTITITVGGATKTETVYFYGAAASVTTTTTTPVIDSGSGAASTAILTATVKDANGNVVPGATVYAISGTTTVFASTSATTGSAGTAAISVLGLTEGTSAVTVQNVATGSTATFSAAAVSIRSGQDLGASVVMSLDKATYAQGEAAVLTVTVKDAAGNAVADGSNTYASAVTSSKAVTGSLPSGVHVTTGSHLGAITYAINVPTTSGAFTITATAGSGWTGTFTATATVSPSAAETAAAAAIAAAADIASAAVDAAAEATDAANAATDAANAAAEAADAATAAAQDAADAIASLATAVAELMADLKAQISAQKAAITALTNLVIKIQKKVKA